MSDTTAAIMAIVLDHTKRTDPEHGPNGWNCCKKCNKLILDIDTHSDGLCSDCHSDRIRDELVKEGKLRKNKDGTYSDVKKKTIKKLSVLIITAVIINTIQSLFYFPFLRF